MSKLILQGDTGTYEPQEDGDDCVAMAPEDGYYFHNEGCSDEYSPLCQLDVAENSELVLLISLKMNLREVNASH